MSANKTSLLGVITDLSVFGLELFDNKSCSAENKMVTLALALSNNISIIL
jgi:hypothetical protein